MVAEVLPPVQPPPPFAAAAFRGHERALQARFDLYNQFAQRENPLFRDVMFIGTSFDFWNTFFYRFVDPVQRRDNPNYLDRIRNSTLTTLDGTSWAVFYSPGSG